MTETPLHWKSITDLSQQRHRGELSPVDLMTHLLDRVEAVDGAGPHAG